MPSVTARQSPIPGSKSLRDQRPSEIRVAGIDARTVGVNRDRLCHFGVGVWTNIDKRRSSASTSFSVSYESMKRGGAQRATPKAKRTSKKVKRARAPVEAEAPKEPRTFVIARGPQTSFAKRLKQDLRCVFLPNTAARLKDVNFNKTRDFLEVCGPLGISHVIALYSTNEHLSLKLIKAPQVPVPSRVASYALAQSVQAAVGVAVDLKHGFRSSPLLVLTNFQKSQHHQLLVTFLQNLFPSLNPHTLEMKNKKRVVLFNYDAEKDLIQFRHYRISIPPSGMNKALKTLLYSKEVPDLGDLQSVGEFLSKSGYASESEGEEAAESRVDLADALLKKQDSTTKRRVKLKELGPRLDLVLHKIEQRVMDGLVLYNSLVEKSLEEIAATGRRREQTAQIRAARRKEQERRVELKRKEKAEKKRKAQKTIPREAVEDDDDAQYYKEEVGLEPDAHFGVHRRREAQFRRKRKKQA